MAEFSQNPNPFRARFLPQEDYVVVRVETPEKVASCAGIMRLSCEAPSVGLVGGEKWLVKPCALPCVVLRTVRCNRVGFCPLGLNRRRINPKF